MRKIVFFLFLLNTLFIQGNVTKIPPLPKVYFRFGESTIKSWFRGNDITLLKIDSIFTTLDRKKLLQIKIEGSASPEGEDLYNEHLSAKRAHILQIYLSEKFNLPDSLFSLYNLGANKIKDENFQNLRYAEINLVEKEAFEVKQDYKDKTILKDTPKNTLNNDKTIANWLCNHCFFLSLIPILFFLLYKYRDRPILILKCILEQTKKSRKDFHGKRFPKTCGTMNKNKTFLTINRSHIPKTAGSNKESRTMGEILKHPIVGEGEDLGFDVFRKSLNKISDVKATGIAYKNGFPDFSPWTLFKVSAEGATSRRYGTNGNMNLYDQRLAKRLNIPTEKVRDFINKNYLVWHENPDGTADLVPQNIHINIPHDGKVSRLKNTDK